MPNTLALQIALDLALLLIDNARPMEAADLDLTFDPCPIMMDEVCLTLGVPDSAWHDMARAGRAMTAADIDALDITHDIDFR